MFENNSDFWKRLKPFSIHIRDVLLVNHELVHMYLASHILLVKRRGISRIWNTRFVHIIDGYLKHDEPSTYDEPTHWLWRTSPRVGQVRQFCFLIRLLISPLLQPILYSIPYARKACTIIHKPNFDSLPNIKEVIGVGKKLRTYPLSQSVLTRNDLRCSSKQSLSLQWRNNERGGVSNHRRLDFSLECLFWRTSKKTSKLRDTGLCEGERVSPWWRHHGFWVRFCWLRFLGALPVNLLTDDVVLWCSPWGNLHWGHSMYIATKCVEMYK